MLWDIFQTFLLSISPFGEARVGIPFGMVKGLNPLLAFLVGTFANLLVFPLFHFLLNSFDKRLWKFRLYRSRSIMMIRNARNGVGAKIHKYGYWGLMIFVMIPLPFTGAYMGVVAGRVLNVETRSALKAISIGVIISSTLIAIATYFSMRGIKLL